MSEKINGLLKGRGVKFIVALGLAGMVLILFSDFFAGGNKKSDIPQNSGAVAADNEEYIKKMEKRLEEALEKISGVGKASVMITSSGSGEYVYAKDEKTDSDSSRISRDEKYVVIGGSGDRNALIRKIDNPEITGVIVVCEGGDSNVVKEKVYSAVSAAFNISSQKIFVTGS